MDICEKADTSKVRKVVENESDEPADQKPPEKDEVSENTGKKERGGKRAEGEESSAEIEEMAELLTVIPTKDDEETAELLTVIPTKGVKEAELLGAEGAEKGQSKTEPKKPMPNIVMYCDKVIAISNSMQRILAIGDMKQLLIEKLGVDTVRIKPILKGEKLIYIYFASEDLLNQGKEVLEERLPNTIKLEIVSGVGLKYVPGKNRLESKESCAANSSLNQSDNAYSSLKRKMEEKVSGEPPAKKDRYTENEVLYFSEESYDEQVKFKYKAAKKTIEVFTKNLRRNIPQLQSMVHNRLKKNNGMVCRLSEFVECSPAQRLLVRCSFVIGNDEDTGEVAVGFSTTKGKVKKNCKTRQYFAPVILQEADVFEKLVKSSEREPCKGTTGFWRELIVRSNTEGKVMLNVVVQAPKEKAQEELDYLKGIITEFYKSEAGKNSKVTSIYSKVIYIDHQQTSGTTCSVALSWGLKYLEEKFLGIRLLLDTKTLFHFSVYAAGIICKTVTELLKPAKRISVVEIGCLSGYLGMHLAKFKCEVLCVGTKPAAAEAVLKEKSSKCCYCPGAANVVLKTLRISSNKACAVITTASQALAPEVSLELRRRKEIKRMVIITEAAELNNSEALTVLINPGDSRELGHLFMPKEIIPVDTMPNTKNFTLVILMERISLDNSPKPKPTRAMGTPFQLKTNVPPNRIVPYQNLLSVQDERALPSGLNPALNQQFVENQLLTSLRLLEEREAEAYRQQLLHEKEREAEEYRQRLIEEKEREVEEYRQRLLEEKQREAAEYQRRLQEERAAEEYKQMQLKERLRILEEQEYKHRLLIEARERELRELSSKPTIQEVLSGTITEAALSRLGNEAAGKLKHVITEAIRDSGILNSEDQAMIRSGQDRIMPSTHFRFAPEHRSPVGGSGVADKSIIRNPWGDSNLPFKDTFSHNKRTNERELMGDRRVFDNVTHTARMTSDRVGRDVHPRSLDNREMSFGRRISKDRNLPFKDNSSENKRIIHEREQMSDRRGFDNTIHITGMASGRKDRDVHIRSSDTREMSLTSRVSKETEIVNKNKPVSLLSLKFHPNTEASLSMQEVAAGERWTSEDDNMYERNWTDDQNRGMGTSEPWRTDTKLAGHADNGRLYSQGNRGMGTSEPWRTDTKLAGHADNGRLYSQGVHDTKQDNWRSYDRSDILTGTREAYSNESRMPFGRDTNRVTETGYESYGGSRNSKPSFYGHTYDHVKQSKVDPFRKQY